ncbi:MAG: hypothetical protein FJ096_22120 [Deltaproteobacteria bacterium]|nr:hypothetical protein [Deltaproteobacteria bacterium]
MTPTKTIDGRAKTVRELLDGAAEVVEHVDPIFYGDPRTAALKVMGG